MKTAIKRDRIYVTHGYDSFILGDPGADSGDEGKSKRAEKYGTKKSKERREEPLGTMSYQTSYSFSGTNQKPERRRPFGTGLVRHCPQGLFSPFFTFLCSIYIFRPFRLSLAPFICPWVSEDAIVCFLNTHSKKALQLSFCRTV